MTPSKDPLKKSPLTADTGHLIIAANRIGSLESLPAGSIAALQTADLLIFEEDRPARKALKMAELHRDYLKYNEHEQIEVLEAAHKAFKQGLTVCYMSDQGVANIADPGRELLSVAYKLDAKITTVPGPSSISSSLAVCPFLEGPFYYHGFLPRKSIERERQLNLISQLCVPCVILEAPYRRKKLLDELLEKLSPKRTIQLSLDIAGEDERHLVGPLKRIAHLSSKILGKINFVLILSPGDSGHLVFK